MSKVKVAVHKFSSCDGCQLAFLNMGAPLLELTQHIDIVHFVEAGYVAPDANVDVTFVEGSISTPHEVERIQRVRALSRVLVTIGACATSGGIQALRNTADVRAWTSAVYAKPEFISTLDRVEPISHHVNVDFELWGCPINSKQIMAAVRAYLLGASPKDTTEKVCLECKRRQTVCVMVTQQQACLGPVTRGGCGAICPSFGRDCYSCYGPQETINTDAIANRFRGFGLDPQTIRRRFQHISNNTPEFQKMTKS